MVSRAEARLEEELEGAYGSYAHTADGDAAYIADPQAVHEFIQQIPELVEQLGPEEIKELAQALEADGLDPEELKNIPGLEDIDLELLEDPAVIEALERELAEMELEEVDPEQIIINGMSLKDWEAHAQAMRQEAEAFRIESETAVTQQMEAEVEVETHVATAEAKATNVPADIKAVDAHYGIAEQKFEAAFEANMRHHSNDTMKVDREGAAAQAEELQTAAKSVADAPSGPFGT